MAIELETYVFMTHKDYGRVLMEVVQVGNPCPHCGGNDYFTMENVSDDNTGFTYDEGFTEPDDRVGIKVKDCASRFEKVVEKNNEIRIIPEDQREWYENLVIKRQAEE